MEHQQTIDGGEGAAASGLLDRSLTIPVARIGFLISLVALIAAALLRLPGLNRFAVSPEAARIALAARNLIEGGDVPRDLLGQPAVVVWTALVMFVGDSNTTLARLAMATLGIAVIALLISMRNWLGTSAPVAALVAALSPTLIAASREIGSASVTIFGITLLLASATWILGGSGRPAFAVCGVALAILLLSGPLGPVALLLSLPVACLIIFQRQAPVDRNELIASAAGLIGTFVLLSSALLTRPLGILAGPGEVFSQLWEQHLSDVGQDPHLLLWNLVLNEPLLLVLAIIGVAADWDRQVTRVGLIWSVASFAILSLLGPATTTSYALSVLPLVLVASIGLSHVIRSLTRSHHRTLHLVTYVIAIVLLGFAFLSVLDILRDAPSDSAGRTVARFLMTLAIAIVPLALAIGWLGRRLIGQRLILVATAALVVVGGFTLRSGVLAASERPSNPDEILSQGTMSETLPTLTDTLRRLSRDLTSDVRDARMPVGGVALRISVDESIADPFRWYFRDFPNLTVFDFASEPIPEDSQIVILPEGSNPTDLAAGYASQSYVFRYEPHELYTAPGWSDLLGDFVQIDGWWRFINFMIDRDASQPAESEVIQVWATSAIADRIFVSTGPYTLSDRPGAGDAVGQFNQPRGVAVDEQGRIYVVDAGNQRVQRFTPDGVHDLTFGSQGSGPGQFAPYPNGPGGPNGIAIGSEGNIFVADTWNHRIQVFSPDGGPLRQWGTYFDTGDDPELASSQPGGFFGPRGIAIHDGLVYVTDTGNERVQVFTEQGEFVRMFGSLGSGSGQLSEPVGIAVASDGTILVADSNNARIARFTIEGQPLEPWPVEEWEEQQFFEPYITIGPDGNIYASDSVNGQISILASDGQLITTTENDELLSSYGLAFGPEGELLYVADGAANAIITVRPQVDE